MKKSVVSTAAKRLLGMLFVLVFFSSWGMQSGQAWAQAAPKAPAEAAAKLPKGASDPNPKNKFLVKVMTPSIANVLSISFTKPVSQAEGQPFPRVAEQLPFSIEPPVEGRATWQDARTLIFISKDLKDGQRYTMTFDPDLKSIYGGGLEGYEVTTDYGKPWSTKYDGTFKKAGAAPAVNKVSLVYRPLGVASIAQKKYSPDSSAIFALNFNLPVEDSEIQKKLEISPKGNRAAKIPFEVLRNSDGNVFVELKASADSELFFFLPQSTKSKESGASLSGDWSKTVKVSSMFATPYVSGNTDYNYPWADKVDVSIRQNPKMTGIKEFITIDPKLDFTVEPNDDGFSILANFVENVPYKVTLLKGMSGDTGVLMQDYAKVVQFSRQNKKISFTGQGKYLSPNLPMLVRLSSKGVDEVKIKAWKVYENNIPTLVTLNSDNSDGEYQTTLSKPVAESRAKIGSTGKIEERVIDLQQMLGMKPGAYFLQAETIIGKDEYYPVVTNQLVVISDLGLAYKLNGKEITAWVNSISQAKPVSDAIINVYNQANQVVAQGKTDSNGFFNAVIQDDSGGPAQYVLTAAKGDDVNYIGRTNDLLEESGMADGGRNYLGNGYEAMCFTPRGIYKPGETVNVKAIVRDGKMLPPAKVFPVLWSIQGPNGRTLGRGTANMSAQGGLDFEQELPFSARTGNYQVSVFLPGAENTPLGVCRFMVEDFVPPRLDIKIKFSQEQYIGADKISAAVDVKYLFGSVGSGLNYEAGIRLDRADFSHPKWKDYSFINDSLTFDPIVESEFRSGKLDASGKTSIEYQPKLDGEMPQALRFTLGFKAMEDGGRWNGKSMSVPVYPKPVLLGIFAPEAQANKSLKIMLAAVTPDGAEAKTSLLKGGLYRVNDYYYRMRNNGGYTRDGNAQELLPVSEVDVTLKNGQGSAEVKFGGSGQYLLKFTDPATGAVVAKRIWAYGGSGGEQGDNTPLNKVSMTFDKPSYKIGDTARVKISAPFGGRLVLAIDNNTDVFRTSKDMSGPETEVSFTVTDDFKPGAFCIAWVARPVEAGQEWSPHRAVGLARVNLDYADAKLNIGFELPERLTPSSKQPIKIKLTDANGAPVKGEISLALMDEGVLSLTRYKTPSPFDFFTADRRLRSSLYDIYNLLMPLESSSIPLLKPGGDGGSDDSGLFSPFKRKQEVLSIFVAKLDSNDKGEIDTVLDIPEYSGAGRLMIVGYAGNKFGNASKTLFISRDVTAEATLPLALAPGDTFEIPVRVFISPLAAGQAPNASAGALGNAAGGKAGNAKDKIKVRLTLSTEGPLQISGADSQEIVLSPSQADGLLFKAVAKPKDSADEQVGVGKVIIKTTPANGESFSQTVEVVVRPPFPRVVRSESGVLKSNNTELKLNAAGLLSGTEEPSISIAGNPGVDIMRAVRFLSSYPYGCLEQTVSTAWPFLVVPDMLASLNPGLDMADQGKRGIESALVRLGTMQNPDGSFNYWPGSPGGYNGVYYWGSIYAAHFLTEVSLKGEVTVPEDMKAAALGWLRDFLSYRPGDNLAYYFSSKAYACYVLALNGDYPLGWMQYLRGNEDKLYESGRIFLAGAYAMHAGNAGPLRELNTKAAVQPDGGRLSTLESAVRTDALKLIMWNAVEPGSNEAAELALTLAKTGRENRWYTTQENAMALFALGTYVYKTSSGKPFKLILSMPDGLELLQATEKQAAFVGPVQLGQGKGSVPDQPFKVQMSGDGTAYYSWTVSGVPLEVPKPSSNDLVLTRSWIMPGPDGKAGKEVPLNTVQDMENALSLAQGDKVMVKLTVTPKPGSNLSDLVILDLLPGGFEIENAKLLDDQIDKSSVSRGTPRVEQREDRLVIIDPWVSGKKTYTYAIRAVTCGDFVIPPTSADLMYAPRTKAILATGKVSIKNPEEAAAVKADKSTEANPVAAKPEETKPVESKPVEAKPAETGKAAPVKEANQPTKEFVIKPAEIIESESTVKPADKPAPSGGVLKNLMQGGGK